jgi:hypothetical protein
MSRKRTRRAAPGDRRRGLALVTALAVAATMLGAGPAGAVSGDHVAARTVVIVHGWSGAGNTEDCRHDFPGIDTTIRGMDGPYPTGLYQSYQYWGYYGNQAGTCDLNFASATTATTLTELADRFSSAFESRFYTGVANPTKVDIIAHSMGGLIVRAALTYHTGRFHGLVEDVVNGGTPHNGGVNNCTSTAAPCDQQLYDASLGSPFLNTLNCRPLAGGGCGPVLPAGVDWTDIGSLYHPVLWPNDGVIPRASALSPWGDHEVALVNVGHAMYFATPILPDDHNSVRAAADALVWSQM